jgi:tRNA G18 (ribose-2'-O)-methylase SpoU
MRKDFVKASLGAEKTVPYESVNSLRAVIKKLQKDGVFVVAIEQDERSVHYKKLGVRFPIACILGNEVLGIEKTILKRVDATVEIPMCGKKESLNVAVAGGIVLSELLGI